MRPCVCLCAAYAGVAVRRQTMFGKFVCSLAMLFGLLYLAMPIAIVGTAAHAEAAPLAVRATHTSCQAPTFTRRTKRREADQCARS